jgi:L-asparaginase II
VTEPLVVVARRGGTVESVHRVHAVAIRDGEVVAAAGDPGLVTFFRSSAKPIQALQLVRARPDLDDRLVAIACASHRAEPAQIEAVRDLLAAGGVTEDDLEVGLQEGRPPERIYHNCSGKHAGMIAVCRARGWPVEGYRRPEHRLQQELMHEVSAAAEVEHAEVSAATDGCGVVCFALPLDRVAHAFARLERLDRGATIVSAMRARPELVGGVGATDTTLMRTLPGWIAKGGAEGLIAAASPDGLGIALEAEDGNSRALRPALAAFARQVGLDLSTFAQVPVKNSHAEVVGVVRIL